MKKNNTKNGAVFIITQSGTSSKIHRLLLLHDNPLCQRLR